MFIFGEHFGVFGAGFAEVDHGFGGAFGDGFFEILFAGVVVVVERCEVVLDLEKIGAQKLTGSAADAAYFAYLFDVAGGLFVGAGDDEHPFLSKRDLLDQVTRAGGDAGAAAGALVVVENGQAFVEAERVVGADLDAIAEAETAVGAGLGHADDVGFDATGNAFVRDAAKLVV